MTTLRTFLSFLFLAAAQLAAAGTVDQRSPFVQGNWWNPDRSGSGMEIFNSGDQTMVLWYTYDSTGKPVWYTAQGATSTLNKDSWPLLQHRWANGKKADPATVGSLKLTFRNVQSADVDFTLNGATGKWSIQPFVATSMLGDTDHSGSWYDPSNSGWGFTVIQQADVLGGALFTYDAGGEATWVSGFERGTNSIEYFAYRGSCPTCNYTGYTTQSVGRLTFAFKDEYHATVASNLSLAMAPGVNLNGANVMQFSRPMSFRAVDRELANFADDATLKAYLQGGMLYSQGAPSPGGFSASPSPATATFSTTNLQEAGVDEADVVKNTATAIYTFAYDMYGSRQNSLRVAPVGGLGLSLGNVTTVALKVEPGQYNSYGGLYADDNTLVAITGSQVYAYVGMSPFAVTGVWAGGKTNVEIFDASGATLQSKWVAQVDGHIVASRRIGNRLYLVTRWSPTAPIGFVYGAPAGSTYEAKNRELVATMTLADLLPGVRVNGSGTRVVAASETFIPPQGVRSPSSDTALITAIDLAKREVAQVLAVAGSVETVYVSPTNLYLVSSRYNARTASGAMTTFDPYGAASDIHQVRLGTDAMAFAASGSVDGIVGTDLEKSPFHLSEDAGKLRVVSQSNSMWGAGSKNRLTILEQAVTTAGTVLKGVSYIPSIWRPEPLGKPGEFLYSTRFAGDRLYAVTFKKIDPLYVVDMSNASDPRIAGALEVPGFSDYLHPVGNGLLLGFGKDAIPAGGAGDGQFAWYQGLALALYDVSDPTRLREIDRAVIGKRGSDSAALHDHHAFTTMTIGNSTSVAFPARIASGSMDIAPPYTYPWSASGMLRYEVRGTTPQNVSLWELTSLMTATTASGPPPSDSAISNGRAVLYPNASFYVGNGQIWRLDAFGKSAGPF